MNGAAVPRGRRGLPRLLTAGLLALGTAIAPILALAPATASAPRAAAPAAVAAADTPTLTLQSYSPAVARPGDELELTVRVTNPGSQPLQGTTLDLGIDWDTIKSRDRLEAWAANELPHQAGTRQGAADVPPVAAGSSEDVTIRVDVDGLRLAGNSRGPRELSVALRDTSNTLLTTLRSFFLWDPDPAGAAAAQPSDDVSLTLLAPVTGPRVDPAHPLSTAELDALTGPVGRLRTVVSAVSAAQEATGTAGALALAVDPALVATAVTSPHDQVSSWAATVAELATKTDIHTLPPYDPDLAALAHAELPAASLKALTTTPLPGGWAVPTSWSDAIAWPASTSAPDQSTLRAAASAGLGTVVVPAGLAATRGTATGLATVRTNAGPVTAVVADTAISKELAAGTNTAALGGVPAATTATTVQRLLAETSLISTQGVGDEPHVLAALPRGWAPDVAALRQTLDALTSSGWVRAAPLTELLASDPPNVPRTPLRVNRASGAETPPNAVHRLDGARTRLADLASVADDPSVLTDPVAPSLVAPLSAAWRAHPKQRSGAVSAALKAAAEQGKGLSVYANGGGVTLISDEGALPITVRNDLPTDAKVTVVLRPDDPRLIVDARPTRVVPEGGQATVQVPVQAIASGDVEVEVQVLTPNGSLATEPVTLKVQVRAGWETVGTAVVGGVIALLFVVGIVRAVRRGRSPSRVSPPRHDRSDGQRPA